MRSRRIFGAGRLTASLMLLFVVTACSSGGERVSASNKEVPYGTGENEPIAGFQAKASDPDVAKITQAYVCVFRPIVISDSGRR